MSKNPPDDTPRSAEEIRREMAQIRYEMVDDFDEIVTNAKVASDWTYYVKAHPLLSAGAAVALGYLVVPSKTQIVSPDASQLERLAKRNRLVVKSNPEPRKQGGAVGALFTLVSGALVRGAITYAGSHLGKLTGLSAASDSQSGSTESGSSGGARATANPASPPPATGSSSDPAPSSPPSRSVPNPGGHR